MSEKETAAKVEEISGFFDLKMKSINGTVTEDEWKREAAREGKQDTPEWRHEFENGAIVMLMSQSNQPADGASKLTEEEMAGLARNFNYYARLGFIHDQLKDNVGGLVDGSGNPVSLIPWCRLLVNGSLDLDDDRFVEVAERADALFKDGAQLRELMRTLEKEYQGFRWSESETLLDDAMGSDSKRDQEPKS